MGYCSGLQQSCFHPLQYYRRSYLIPNNQLIHCPWQRGHLCTGNFIQVACFSLPFPIVPAIFLLPLSVTQQWAQTNSLCLFRSSARSYITPVARIPRARTTPIIQHRHTLQKIKIPCCSLICQTLSPSYLSSAGLVRCPLREQVLACDSWIHSESPQALRRASALFWIDSVSVSDSTSDSFFHMLKLGSGGFGLRSGKRPLDWTELWGAADPPPKRSFTSGNLIAVYLNYRDWDEKRRPNELQVARHVQTITAGLQRAAPGSLD